MFLTEDILDLIPKSVFSISSINVSNKTVLTKIPHIINQLKFLFH